MAPSTLKALLVAFATLSSAAPTHNETLNGRGLEMMGGMDCCTWEGCAKCFYGKCILNKSTAEGVCPYKSNTLPAPVPSGEKCCHGIHCEPCLFGECKVTDLLFGHEGYCPWYEDPENPLIDPGYPCIPGIGQCRFGHCQSSAGLQMNSGICPTEGETKPRPGLGQSCCVKASCPPCEFPYYCEILAKPNFHNLPPNTCQFD